MDKIESSEQEKISVIIPVYNGEAFIDQCLKNITSQSYTNLEIICINDGSCDDTLKKLKAWTVKDNRIKVFTQENKGLGASRNLGLQKATGKYIAFVDCDDKTDLIYFEELYKAIKRYQADIAQGSIANIDEKEKEILCADFLSRLKQQKNGSSCNKLYKAEVIKENNLYFCEGLLWEDNLFTLKICAFAKKLCLVPQVKYYYTENAGSLSRSAKNFKKRKQDSLVVAGDMMCFIESYKDKELLNITKRFILNNLVLWEFLKDKKYRQKINKIIKQNALVKKISISLSNRLSKLFRF